MEHFKNLDLKDIIYFCEIDSSWKKENWNTIPNYEDYYQVSNLGRVKSLTRKVWNGFSFFLKKEMI